MNQKDRMSDETVYFTGDQSFYDRATAQITELDAALRKAKDENSKLMEQNEDLKKRRIELRSKIEFLKGQIEAYQYCMNRRQ